MERCADNRIAHALGFALAVLITSVAGPSTTHAEPIVALESPAPRGAAAAVAPLLVARSTAGPVAPALRTPDVIFVPTPHHVVDAMLRLAALGKDDVLYDLGCGDGRIPIAAARQYRVRAVGIDIDPERIREADANSRAAGTTALASFRHGDLFEADLSEATVVTLYLLSHLNDKLRPKLVRELRPGARVVSHTFGIGDWIPDRRIDVGGRSVYLWILR